MIIPIDPLTRIKGTERAWELQKVRTRNGQPTWEPYKWFTTFRSALDGAVHREIRLHPAVGIAEAIEAEQLFNACCALMCSNLDSVVAAGHLQQMSDDALDGLQLHLDRVLRRERLSQSAVQDGETVVRKWGDCEELCTTDRAASNGDLVHESDRRSKALKKKLAAIFKLEAARDIDGQVLNADQQAKVSAKGAIVGELAELGYSVDDRSPPRLSATENLSDHALVLLLDDSTSRHGNGSTDLIDPQHSTSVEGYRGSGAENSDAEEELVCYAKSSDEETWHNPRLKPRAKRGATEPLNTPPTNKADSKAEKAGGNAWGSFVTSSNGTPLRQIMQAECANARSIHMSIHMPIHMSTQMPIHTSAPMPALRQSSACDGLWWGRAAAQCKCPAESCHRPHH